MREDPKLRPTVSTANLTGLNRVYSVTNADSDGMNGTAVSSLLPQLRSGAKMLSCECSVSLQSN
jgi:hypothetical protein